MQALIRIATRQSPLALSQAHEVKRALENKFPALKTELVGITTEADKRLDISLEKIGGKGLFVKELEIALKEGRADIAVHSMKDVPAQLPDGFVIAAVTERINPYDAFISNQFNDINALPLNAVVGTSSLRRACQLKALRSDLTIKFLRGNVETRLSKLDKGEYDAIILAVAGLERLNLTNRIRVIIPPEVLLPAPGQGALGVECRADNKKLITMLRTINHSATERCILAERALSKSLGGNCHVPLAAYAVIKNKRIHLCGIVGQPDGAVILSEHLQGDMEHAEQLGERLASLLLARGAADILRP